jgi:hypothetical protein
VAGVYVLLAGLAVLIGALKFRGVSALRKTRRTVQDDLSMLRHDGATPVATSSAGAE